MISKLARAAVLAATIGSVSIPAAEAGPPRAAQAGGPAAVATEPAPFARVYLAIKGCTSCAHCRTTIRQMVNTKSAGGEAHMSADQVEVRYPKPTTVPLKDVIHSLAENRLHDLSLVDVLFEARGTVVPGPNGTATFKLAETGQAFPVTIDKAVRRPTDGTAVRLTAVVDGWRTKDKSALSLYARTIETN
ncbi:MAG TPA: hypothetical protein VL857_11660 [Candidatus Eisenbacteria bacterium]|jgi:hypothetical protein|nr:hypothetical protein [Candidatus Eisenbacteria bacterium]